jgi:hypothetical protein
VLSESWLAGVWSRVVGGRRVRAMTSFDESIPALPATFGVDPLRVAIAWKVTRVGRGDQRLIRLLSAGRHRVLFEAER